MDLPENWEQNDNASWFNQWLIISGMDWTFRGPGYQVRSRPKRIDAIKKLRNKGIFRSRLHEISSYRLKSQVPLTQLVSILIQLERLQKSGFPLNRSLQLIVSETSDPHLAYALCKIR